MTPIVQLTERTPVWVGSPNCNPGRKGFRPEAIVIHIAEGTTASVDSWFRQMGSQVSAHYLVTRTGKLHQYVREEDTAWHAGRVERPTWSGIRVRGNGDAGYINPNLYTIGIEHEGDATTPWPEIMYARSAMLLAELHVRWAIPLDRQHICGHREIFAGKTCPGMMVDIDRLIALARTFVGNNEELSP